MNTGHVRAAALAAAVIMMLARCAAAQGDAGLTVLTKPGDRNVTVAAIPSADLAGLYIAQDEGLFAPAGAARDDQDDRHRPGRSRRSAERPGRHRRGQPVGYVAARRRAQVPHLARLPPSRRTRACCSPPPARASRPWPGGRQEDAVNGTNSIGTCSLAYCSPRTGYRQAQVRFVTDKQGFPDMAGQLQRGRWDAAFLAEP